jgi:SAM-dependent methyltransferase
MRSINPSCRGVVGGGLFGTKFAQLMRRIFRLRPFLRQRDARNEMQTVNLLNKQATSDFGQASLGRPTAAPSSGVAEHPQSLLELPRGAARESLLAVHRVLATELPPSWLAIYEAGGGSTSFLPLDVLRRAHVTLVDIDEEQIRNNDYAQEAILGDIQRHRFPTESFDLITCYNVIEHLADVESTLQHFCDALKPGGLLLIGAPNPQSLSGIVTRFSPHWFHVWFYRHVRGDRNAGRPGHAPFPTVFHRLVAPSKLERFVTARGLETIYRREFESPRFPEMRARKPMLAALLDSFAAVLNFLLPADSDVRRGDYHIILRKRAA